MLVRFNVQDIWKGMILNSGYDEIELGWVLWKYEE
jgi:hypothetical protein